jgi:carbonic anhydrase/acetyltransferase-like protein (isoleucine patch superfamily)
MTSISRAVPGPIILPWNGIVPTIDAMAFVAPTAVVIGDIVIGPETSIWFGCVLRGDVHEIRIGARVNIQDGSVVHVTGGRSPTHIGDGVSIGHMVLIHGCRLEPGSFVGSKACVLDNVVVETGAMVAAGAVVPPGKRVPAGELWAGNPAKKLRDLAAKDLEMFRRVEAGYAGRGAAYRELLAGLGGPAA